MALPTPKAVARNGVRVVPETDRILQAGLSAIRARRPRIHCVLNAVAQPIVANALVAIGAEPSMSVHPREIIALSNSADALLVNLGMLDPMREEALGALAQGIVTYAKPLVLDPVMVDRSPFRLALAQAFLAAPSLVIKGNREEMQALAVSLPTHAIRATTGLIDVVEAGEQRLNIHGGHRFLPLVSGTGCLAGALIASFTAVMPDRAEAAFSALTLLRHAGAEAGDKAAGPGSFAMQLIDRLAAKADLAERRR